ncbi:hypothetical protein F3Y22_tig00113725pilonHSYRG00516 [Hibiscus syriacus]|uniref:Uncharacterized protein n=1 Tax=Hibiscus syriacus TaxID=106335 RepID=A0A6A2XHB5_HIBSY|nr:hypothetical protein F3Y22_tig00113725pilonHSYRG00516 [Hibiscus syriacus]
MATFVLQKQAITLPFDSGSCDSSSVSNQKKKKRRKFSEIKAEVSESSCVESNSGADFLDFGEPCRKLRKENDNLEKPEINDAVSDISGVQLVPYGTSKLSSENKENDLVYVTSKFQL